jgi:hypothetical protein
MLMKQHPQVKEVREPDVDRSSSFTAIDVVFDVNLPSEWKEKGCSPNGVRRQEVVRYEFPPSYPLDPPTISLRPDFDKSLPHFHPSLVRGRPAPCISEQPLSELLHQNGLSALLNQTAVWLDRAAGGTLIDPEQGWEPMRIDSARDVIVANSAAVRDLVDRQGGHVFLGFNYLAVDEKADGPFIRGALTDERLVINPNNITSLFNGAQIRDNISTGRSIALVVWPGKRSSGELIVSTEYSPEVIENSATLLSRAANFGCADILRSQFSWIETCLAGRRPTFFLPICVVFCVRRPFHLIRSPSNIELCFYITSIGPGAVSLLDRERSIRPAGHSEEMGVSILRLATEGIESNERVSWSLLGCGSLGSKIALHLTRSGRAPATVVDRGMMRPHNAARHALLPRSRNSDVLWSDYKANMLATSLHAFGEDVTAYPLDVVKGLESEEGCRKIWPRDTWGIVNATASLRVRAALTRTLRRLPFRVIEASLFARGRRGLLTIEGPNRNPLTGDLMAEAYALAVEGQIPELLPPEGTSEMEHLSVGQGCGSATMIMSDAQVSMFAASMAEAIAARQRTGLEKETGEILSGELGQDGLSLQWQLHKIRPVTIVVPETDKSWRVRIHAKVANAIDKDVSRWSQVETGGILLGRFSEATKIFNVVDILAAPSDSVRSAAEFVLGTDGVTKNLRNYGRRSAWTLYCLGTWHSHLAATGPSGLDRKTAVSVALARITPSLLLIRTPSGFRALIADAAEL